MSHAVSYGPASVEIVSVGAVREHCRVDCELSAAQASAWVNAALEHAERYTGRLFAPRTATVTLPGFPRSGPIRLPVEPVRAVTAIRYRDVAGTLTTLSSSDYQTALGFSPPLVAPASGMVWPDTQTGALSAVEIDLTVGPLVPPTMVRQAVLLTVGYWYAHRGDGGDPEKTGLPPAAIRLLNLLDAGGYH